MKADKIAKLFRDYQADFDVETPELGHEQRFLKKLKSSEVQVVDKIPRKISYKPFMTIAASIIICFGLFFILQNKTKDYDLASISPELSQTQDFFTSSITSELNKIKAQRSLVNEIVISDALKQLELLEKNYEQLKRDLEQSGNDKRVIYAMISNFQNRINILENVLETMDDLKQLKQPEKNEMTL